MRLWRGLAVVGLLLGLARPASGQTVTVSLDTATIKTVGDSQYVTVRWDRPVDATISATAIRWGWDMAPERRISFTSSTARSSVRSFLASGQRFWAAVDLYRNNKIVATGSAQYIKPTGTVKPDTVFVPVPVVDSVPYPVHDTTYVKGDTVRVPYPVYDTVKVLDYSKLAIIQADTTSDSLRTTDSLIVTRRVLTTLLKTDTLSRIATGIVVVLKADSVRLYSWGLASYDTTNWVTGNFKVFPLTMPGWVNLRWLLSGTQVGTSVQVQHYSTARFPRPAAGTYTLVGCARVQGQLTTTPEVCSPGYPLVIKPLNPTPPDTTTTVPAPPDTTTGSIPPCTACAQDTIKPMVVLGLARLVNDSTGEVPVWIRRSSGKHIAVTMEAMPSSAEHPFPTPYQAAALMQADTMTTRSYPNGMGPICVWGGLGQTRWDSIGAGLRGYDTIPQCVAANNITPAEMTIGVPVTFEAPAPGSAKLMDACALVYTTTQPSPMAVHSVSNIQGVSSCTGLFYFMRDSMLRVSIVPATSQPYRAATLGTSRGSSLDVVERPRRSP